MALDRAWRTATCPKKMFPQTTTDRTKNKTRKKKTYWKKSTRFRPRARGMAGTHVTREMYLHRKVSFFFLCMRYVVCTYDVCALTTTKTTTATAVSVYEGVVVVAPAYLFEFSLTTRFSPFYS